MKKYAIHILITIGYFLILLSIWVFQYLDVKEIQQEWEVRQLTYMADSKTLSDLNRQLGFGGLIHEFKNYVIRREKTYFERAKSLVENSLVTLNSSAFLQHPRHLVGDITEVVREYQNKLIWMSNNMARISKLTTEELDRFVRVDDTKAFSALAKLDEINRSDYLKITESTRVRQTIYRRNLMVWCAIFTLIYWGVSGLTLRLYYLSQSHLKHLELIRNLSPLAMVLVDKKGRVLEINPAFKRMFLIDKHSEVEGLTIEAFIPDTIKNKHKEYRRHFQKTNREVPMNERGRLFDAKRLNGEIFPAAISVASIKEKGSEFSLAVIDDKSSEELLREQSKLDHLTSAHNRRYAEDILNKEIYRLNRYDVPLTILIIDIDKFKEINDRFGHNKGDQVLISVVEVFENRKRHSDIFSRWGGDEFVFILPETTEENACLLAENLLSDVRNRFSGAEINVTVSIGIYTVDKKIETSKAIENVDKALYMAKNSGRDQWRVFTGDA